MNGRSISNTALFYPLIIWDSSDPGLSLCSGFALTIISPITQILLHKKTTSTGKQPIQIRPINIMQK